jgi:hypothetical protein
MSSRILHVGRASIQSLSAKKKDRDAAASPNVDQPIFQAVARALRILTAALGWRSRLAC